MARFVVEPAVALKWFVPEEHSGFAARLLDGGHELLAPDTMPADTGKIITAKTRMGECSTDEGIQLLEAIRSVPFWFHPVQPLMEPAYLIASTMNRPLEDGLNLALAVASDCRLVTARGILYERMQDTPFARYVKWVGDIR
jgi:predicted nucleic acid-binding protein